ncbi:unnamed protein product [Caenorhabditis sp. 36 PRJEB53466]|nr:unnamed protein product [Caenorhabditis sp. 36 PRJEB53466]
MFMKITESSSTSSSGSTGYSPFEGGAAAAEPPKWVGSAEFGLFVAEIAINIFTVLLNTVVCFVLWRAVKPEYKACFYIIMRSFNCFVALNALGTLIVIMNRQDSDFVECWWIQGIFIVNMFTCIASSIWLFYAGLNRMMVLVYPGKIIKAWGCWIVRVTLLLVSLLALGLSIVYQKFCGMYTRYDAVTNTIQVVADNMAEPLTIAVYVFPLSSLAFYAVAYNNLQKKRLLVTSDKTKAIIDKAERRTLKIGMMIMCTYALSLFVHILLTYFCTDETFSSIYNRIDEIVSCAPQIALPLALLSCNHKLFRMRKLSSAVSSQTGTLQDIYPKDTFMSEGKSSKVHMDKKMSTASN